MLQPNEYKIHHKVEIKPPHRELHVVVFSLLFLQRDMLPATQMHTFIWPSLAQVGSPTHFPFPLRSGVNTWVRECIARSGRDLCASPVLPLVSSSGFYEYRHIPHPSKLWSMLWSKGRIFSKNVSYHLLLMQYTILTEYNRYVQHILLNDVLSCWGFFLPS